MSEPGVASPRPSDRPADVEAVVGLSSGLTLGLSLRPAGALPIRRAMLDLLLEAFRQNWTVVVTFDTRPNVGRVIVGVHAER